MNPSTIYKVDQQYTGLAFFFKDCYNYLFKKSSNGHFLYHCKIDLHKRLKIVGKILSLKKTRNLQNNMN